MKKIITALITSLFLLAPPAFAASQGIKISPVTFDLVGSPGQKITNIVKVSNPSSQEIAVTASIQDFAPQGEDGGVEITSGYQYGLSKYIEIFPKAFSLAPAELQFVTVTISIPKDAPAGARSGAILFGSGAGAPQGSGSVISGQVGVLLVLNILGDAKDQAKLAAVETPLATSRGPVNFDLRIQNTGVTVAKFSGQVAIYNVLGSKVAGIPLGPNNILPGAIRRFSATYGEKDPFGIYRAELTGAFGTVPIRTTWYFAGASPNYLGPIGIVGLVLLALLLRRRKRAP